MNAEEYDLEAAIEARHWWFGGRRQMLRGVMETLVGRGRRAILICDIGCGVGNNCEVLAPFGSVLGMDLSLQALRHCIKKSYAGLALGNAESMDFVRGECADVVVALDMLEHLDRDESALAEFFRILKPGGHAVVSVPAFEFLWGLQDEVGEHRRRYRLPALAAKMERAGFQIVRKTYFNTFFFFPVLLIRSLRRALGMEGGIERRLDVSALNGVFRAVFGLEIFLLRWISYPFGVSILVIGKKPEAREKTVVSDKKVDFSA